jgi:hypothetical protein
MIQKAPPCGACGPLAPLSPALRGRGHTHPARPRTGSGPVAHGPRTGGRAATCPGTRRITVPQGPLRRLPGPLRRLPGPLRRLPGPLPRLPGPLPRLTQPGATPQAPSAPQSSTAPTVRRQAVAATTPMPHRRCPDHTDATSLLLRSHEMARSPGTAALTSSLPPQWSADSRAKGWQSCRVPLYGAGGTRTPARALMRHQVSMTSTTFPVFCCVSTYLAASATSWSG